MSKRVLGIDPGLRVTGYGAIDFGARRPRLIEAGVVAPDTRATLEERLNALHAGITAVVSATQPDIVVIEELFSAYKNPLTAVLMGHARGVLCLAAAQNGIAVETLGHSLVKRALTGSGAAKKEQVRSMVIQLLGLRRVPEPADVSDALALALAYANMRDHARRLPAAAHVF